MAAILFRCSASEAMQRTTMYDRPFASWPRSTTQTCRRRATSIASAASLGQPRSSRLQRAGDSGGLWLQASSRRGTRRLPTFQHKPKLPLVNMRLACTCHSRTTRSSFDRLGVESNPVQRDRMRGHSLLDLFEILDVAESLEDDATWIKEKFLCFRPGLCQPEAYQEEAASRGFWRDDQIVVDKDGIPHYTGVLPGLMREYRSGVLFAYQSLEGSGDDEEKEKRSLRKKQTRLATKLIEGLHGEAWRACQELVAEPESLKATDGYKKVFACLQQIGKVSVIKATEAIDTYLEKCSRKKDDNAEGKPDEEMRGPRWDGNLVRLWTIPSPEAEANEREDKAREHYTSNRDYYYVLAVSESNFLFRRKEIRLDDLNHEQRRLFTAPGGSAEKEWKAWLSQGACDMLSLEKSRDIGKNKADLIIPTRWVRTNKNDSIYGADFLAKSRLVVQGFKDIKNAYFSGKSMTRQIYLEPPRGGLPGVYLEFRGQLLQSTYPDYLERAFKKSAAALEFATNHYRDFIFRGREMKQRAVPEKRDRRQYLEEPLEPEEMELYQSSAGELGWLARQLRCDLACQNGVAKRATQDARGADFHMRIWSDASLTDSVVVHLLTRPRQRTPEHDETMCYRSVGGYSILLANKGILASHLAEAVEAGDWIMVVLEGALTGKVDLRNWPEVIQQRQSVYAADARSVFDYLQKPGAHVRWIDGMQNMSDVLTKLAADREVMKEFLRTGMIGLTQSDANVQLKEKKQAERARRKVAKTADDTAKKLQRLQKLEECEISLSATAAESPISRPKHERRCA
ncbi:unnamed protein product [Symbiodinium necroappetens]|uniref:Uncharacterized protein n=1 Tax=Symbiodinium necroappetens TaxID=1628268 RepID=A0A812VAK3_9DINO|nr:unnamed protein product [Symbiodinium necroappetens]